MQVSDQNKLLSTRMDILDAAVERFRHFGIGKTAMADIAHDVDMSTANLYRYFKNKEDIAVACSRRCLDDRRDQISEVVNNPDLNAAEKLQSFFLAILEYTHNQVSLNSRINELVNIIAEKYPEVVHEKNNVEKILISKILLQGKNEKDFNVDDIERTTIAVHTALHIFQLPLSMTIYSLDELRDKARITTELLLKGLR